MPEPPADAAVLENVTIYCTADPDDTTITQDTVIRGNVTFIGNLLTTKGVVLANGAKHYLDSIILQIGDTADEFNKLYVRRFDMRCTNLGADRQKLSATEITAWWKANEAAHVVKEAINQASKARAYYGAVQSRLEHTIQSLDTTVENLSASETRIRCYIMVAGVVFR